MGLNNSPLVEELTGSKDGKNSKGVMINQIHNLSMKWKTILVSICLKILGWLSDIK